MTLREKFLIDNALANCHAKGLNSYVLQKSPVMVRMFIATPSHELWKNNALSYNKMSVGFHSHHCAISLVPLFGSITNIKIKHLQPYNEEFPKDLQLFPYLYSSGVLGKPSFIRMHHKPMVPQLTAKTLEKMDSLLASERHTIFVPRSTYAAWLVIERSEDPYYLPITWSNDNLEQCDWSDMYKPMTVEILESDRNILQQNDVWIL